VGLRLGLQKSRGLATPSPPPHLFPGLGLALRNRPKDLEPDLPQVAIRHWGPTCPCEAIPRGPVLAGIHGAVAGSQETCRSAELGGHAMSGGGRRGGSAHGMPLQRLLGREHLRVPATWAAAVHNCRHTWNYRCSYHGRPIEMSESRTGGGKAPRAKIRSSGIPVLSPELRRVQGRPEL